MKNYFSLKFLIKNILDGIAQMGVRMKRFLIHWQWGGVPEFYPNSAYQLLAVCDSVSAETKCKSLKFWSHLNGVDWI